MIRRERESERRRKGRLRKRGRVSETYECSDKGREEKRW